MTDRISDIWGERTPYAQGGEWPDRVDIHLLDGVRPDEVRWVQSACVLCSNGCGMDIGVRDGKIVGVRGRAVDRVNHGRLGPKGLFGWQANAAADRLTTPQIRRDGQLVDASWDEAMTVIADRSRQILAESGPLAMGFYTSGQLFLEDYYALAVLARGGIGTPHLDGNTRLCTATAGAALKESFGCDGDPGSLTDIDACDTLFAVGHNLAETQTVLWMRMLDRLHGPDRPKLVVVDPRRTKVAELADVHLAIRSGTNVALLNAIQHELIEHDWIDHEFVDSHTVEVGRLSKMVAAYPPERAAQICGVDAADIRRAAEVIGSAERLVSTCLQGVYQSHQATAAACQVNNITLLRGMIGKPGCTVFQMNGQPTAENTRETGANGDLTATRNWQNPAHIAELARLWGVPEQQIPSWGPPAHIMQILRYAEQGSLRFLWVTGTNPMVSLPDLARIGDILRRPELFLVVTDAFPTETTELADVVLPAALWGEKTGTFTNYDRTVHLSEQAVEPPGRARSDLAIFLDYAERLGLTRTDGSPLLPWRTPQEVFGAFAEATRGRLCDYTGLSYDKLRGGSGVQWPCDADHPDGTERLYTDHTFWSGVDVCEDYGHDLLTGATQERKDYAALHTEGRAIFKAADYVEPAEPVDDDYPLLFTTGRTAYHFHTRTKTARAPELQHAAPEAWVEISPADAARLGVAEGDLVAVESRRGRMQARARVSGVREGVVFAPFHYGSRAGSGHAANAVTQPTWDPVSKQPLFKTAAVRLEKLADSGGVPAPAPSTTASAPVEVTA
ncbi:nitrate reductase [Hamadaea sp. NPDC051192]|uniref:molybdopterin oxidoreductase family protein n=1 Tax=Hamadaea sp. NPDC051192 TaxID=3154940 RepID=UPI003428DA88